MVGVALRRIGRRVGDLLRVGEANSPVSPIWGLDVGGALHLDSDLDQQPNHPAHAFPAAARFRLPGRRRLHPCHGGLDGG